MEKTPEIDEKALAELTGYKPNKWQAEVDKVDARFLVLDVGRRGGKTQYVVHSPVHGIVRDFLLPNQYVWIVAPNYDLTQRVWSEVEKLAQGPLRPFVKRFQNTKGSYKIETVLGTVIEAKSAEDPEMLIGVGLTKLIVDEAARVKEKAWFQALRPTLADKKGSAIFISTPRGHNWFFDLFTKGQDPEDTMYKSFKYTTYDNDYLAKDEIDEMVKDMPEYEYHQEIMADFRSNIEQVFPMEKVRKGPLATPQQGCTMGIDLGKTNDYTVIIGINPDGQCCWFERMRTDWFGTLDAIRRAYGLAKPTYLRVDATGRGDPIVEQLIYAGIPCEPFVFSAQSKKQLMDKTALIIERGMLVLPEDEKILFDEMAAFGRELTPSNNYIYKPLKKITDDCVDALALATWDMFIPEDMPNEEGGYGNLFNEESIFTFPKTDF